MLQKSVVTSRRKLPFSKTVKQSQTAASLVAGAHYANGKRSPFTPVKTLTFSSFMNSKYPKIIVMKKQFAMQRRTFVQGGGRSPAYPRHFSACLSDFSKVF